MNNYTIFDFNFLTSNADELKVVTRQDIRTDIKELLQEYVSCDFKIIGTNQLSITTEIYCSFKRLGLPTTTDEFLAFKITSQYSIETKGELSKECVAEVMLANMGVATIYVFQAAQAGYNIPYSFIIPSLSKILSWVDIQWPE